MDAEVERYRCKSSDNAYYPFADDNTDALFKDLIETKRIR